MKPTPVPTPTTPPQKKPAPTPVKSSSPAPTTRPTPVPTPTTPPQVLGTSTQQRQQIQQPAPVPTQQRQQFTQPAPAPTQQRQQIQPPTVSFEQPTVSFEQTEGFDPQAYQREIEALINEQAQAQLGYLNQAQDVLTASNREQLAGIGRQFTAARDDLSRQFDASRQELARDRDDAYAQARRAEAERTAVYSDMQRGYQQRFGGASSAGQAASEILDREFLRNQGKAQEQLIGLLSDIDNKKFKLQQDYNSSIERLELNRDKALAEATRDFQNKLIEITKMKADVEGNKAQKRLNALLELRDRVFAINLDNMRQRQQLEAMRQQADLELEQYARKVMLESSLSKQGVRGFSETVSRFKPGQEFRVSDGKYAIATQPVYIGKIGKWKIGEDELGRTVYDDGTVGWSQWDDFGNEIKAQPKPQPGSGSGSW